MTDRIRLGISTCPNDTFAFHAILHSLVDLRGLEFDVRLLDIQQLNDGLFAGQFDAAKASFHAALLLSESMAVLPSGSALGFGVGPLLLAAAADTEPAGDAELTLCPGEHTTAHLLFKLFHPDTTRVEQALFSDIMPRLRGGTADFGVCIHEGRFTWRDQGLHLVEDLGTRWEAETGSPLPLGGILASRSLPADVVTRLRAVVRDSVLWGLAHREQTLPTMRQYAQEFDDVVLMRHVDLYVNEWTVDLGEVGRGALAELGRRAAAVGIVAAGREPLLVA